MDGHEITIIPNPNHPLRYTWSCACGDRSNFWWSRTSAESESLKHTKRKGPDGTSQD